MNNILELKKRIDSIINSLNNGNYNNPIEILLDELELINIDRDILQNTRIGSSLTKLSKSLLPIHKLNSQRVITIINKWKSQLRIHSSLTVTGNNTTVVPATNTNTIKDTTESTGTKDTNSTTTTGTTTTNTTNTHTTNTHTTNTHTTTNTTNTTNTVTQKNSNEIASVTKSGESSKNTGVSVDTSGSVDSVDTSGSKDGVSGVTSGTSDGVGDGPDTVMEEKMKYMGPLRNDINRDKALRYLFDSFMIGKDFDIEMKQLTEIINLLEKSLYDYYIIEKNNQKGYNQQLKCIGFNLKDNKNTVLNYKLYNNIISINELIHMSSLQMASDEKKLQRNEILEQSLEACQSDWEIKNIFLNNKTKGQFKCNKCNSKTTTYYQLQTRSSDEPMTTFVTCLNCNNRWKF